jgi:hypothetical protein
VRAAILVGLLPLLCACGATRFDMADATRIKTIAVAKVEDPKYFAYAYFVQHQDPLVQDDNQDLNALMEKQNLRLGAELSAAVVQALHKDGYDVTDSGANDADAEMTLSVGGFLGGQPGPTYSSHGAELEPEFMVRAKLTDGKTKKKLFEQYYLFANNSIKPMDGTMLLVPDKKYYFTSDKEMFAKPEVAAAGFRSVIPLVAEHIAVSLKRP